MTRQLAEALQSAVDYVLRASKQIIFSFIHPFCPSTPHQEA